MPPFVVLSTKSSLESPPKLRTVRKPSCGVANASWMPSLVPGEKTREVFELIVEEGVKFVETSGRNPEEFMPLLKQAGVKVLHKVPSVRSRGVDIADDFNSACSLGCGLDDGGRSSSPQSILHSRGPIGEVRHSGDANGDMVDFRSRHFQPHRDADDGVS